MYTSQSPQSGSRGSGLKRTRRVNYEDNWKLVNEAKSNATRQMLTRLGPAIKAWAKFHDKFDAVPFRVKKEEVDEVAERDRVKKLKIKARAEWKAAEESYEGYIANAKNTAQVKTALMKMPERERFCESAIDDFAHVQRVLFTEPARRDFGLRGR